MATLNDLIRAFLASKGISFSAGDFTTCQPDGEAEQIETWDVGKLGTEPSAADLAAAGAYVAVPASVTPLQGRLALNAAGKLAAVKTAVAAAGQATQIWFEYATVWERANGLTDAQIDALFIQASAL